MMIGQSLLGLPFFTFEASYFGWFYHIIIDKSAEKVYNHIIKLDLVNNCKER